MPRLDRIEINPKIMLGKSVVRGTRITVELILQKLSEGAKEEELLAAYPHLQPEDIRTALEKQETDDRRINQPHMVE